GLPIIASDNITKEVQITDLVYFKMIEEEPNQWAKKIDDLYLLFREDMTERIIEAGFDVKDTAKELENYYFSILKEGSKNVSNLDYFYYPSFAVPSIFYLFRD